VNNQISKVWIIQELDGSVIKLTAYILDEDYFDSTSTHALRKREALPALPYTSSWHGA
jgi:hypothetical protein